MNPSIETLKQILYEDKLTLSLGIVNKLTILDNNSSLFVGVKIFPDGQDIETRMTFAASGPDAGIIQFPELKDLVLIGFVDGDVDQAFVIKSLSSQVDFIPEEAKDGSLVIKARKGKKLLLNSDEQINLSRKGDGDESLVLGNEFKKAYSKQLEIDSSHTHVGNLGFPTAPPSQAQDYLSLKASPVDDNKMLSDLTKTEK